MTVVFRNEPCSLVWGRYYDDSGPCLRLVVEATGEPMATCTINLEIPPPEGYVYIKDYTENEGMLAALVSAGVVEDTGERLPSGFVEIPLCKLLVSPDSVSLNPLIPRKESCASL